MSIELEEWKNKVDELNYLEQQVDYAYANKYITRRQKNKLKNIIQLNIISVPMMRKLWMIIP